VVIRIFSSNKTLHTSVPHTEFVTGRAEAGKMIPKVGLYVHIYHLFKDITFHTYVCYSYRAPVHIFYWISVKSDCNHWSAQDTCIRHPNRKLWAMKKCGILKSSVFQPCHS